MTVNVLLATDTVLTGHTVTLTATVRDVDGYLADSSTTPVIQFIADPNDDALPGFPVDMTRISTGIYEYDFAVPSGLAYVGTYTASITWPFPDTFEPQYLYILIFASYPLRNSYVSPR